MALEPHHGAALDVQHDAVPVVTGCRDRFAGYNLPGEVEEESLVEPVEPGQATLEVARVQPAAGDAVHIFGLAGQGRCAREVREFCVCGGNGRDLRLPVFRELAGQVECGPVKSARHNQPFCAVWRIRVVALPTDT